MKVTLFLFLPLDLCPRPTPSSKYYRYPPKSHFNLWHRSEAFEEEEKMTETLAFYFIVAAIILMAAIVLLATFFCYRFAINSRSAMPTCYILPFLFQFQCLMKLDFSGERREADSTYLEARAAQAGTPTARIWRLPLVKTFLYFGIGYLSFVSGGLCTFCIFCFRRASKQKARL